MARCIGEGSDDLVGNSLTILRDTLYVEGDYQFVHSLDGDFRAAAYAAPHALSVHKHDFGKVEATGRWVDALMRWQRSH